MNESINTSFLIGMIAAFITIISLLMITFFSYSRAFKTKNKMVDIIEKYNGYNNSAKNEIEQYLKDVGYNVKRKSKNCPKYDGENSINNIPCDNYFVYFSFTKNPKASDYWVSSKHVYINKNKTYAYCVYEFSTNRGKYYTVYIFANLNFPVINNIIEVKIKGQTRTIYDL